MSIHEIARFGDKKFIVVSSSYSEYAISARSDKYTYV